MNSGPAIQKGVCIFTGVLLYLLHDVCKISQIAEAVSRADFPHIGRKYHGKIGIYDANKDFFE
jgi:hypothetical protein